MKIKGPHLFLMKGPRLMYMIYTRRRHGIKIMQVPAEGTVLAQVPAEGMVLACI